jgi:hypothetical protein
LRNSIQPTLPAKLLLRQAPLLAALVALVALAFLAAMPMGAVAEMQVLTKVFVNK